MPRDPEISGRHLRPVVGDLATVDLGRLEDALDACDFLVENLTPEARYEVDERWGPEGELYNTEICWTLLEAYRITGGQDYLENAKAILDRLKDTQRPAGGWSLKLGSDGLEFRATDDERRDTWEQEDLPVVGAATYAVAKYRRLTGDDSYDDVIDRALDHLLEHWDSNQGCFLEQPDEHFVGMRSVPTGYQAFFLLGLSAWRPWRRELDAVVPKLIEYIRGNFESFDDHTMPFMRLYHMALLMKHSSSEYVTQEIKPRVDRLIGSEVYKCSWATGGYGHRDSYRGIVTTEANVRGSGAVALAMKLYDLTTATRTYRDSKAYRDVAAWIDFMKAERGYYEFLTQHDRKRKGKGSPAQYVPCWWIFGEF